MEKLVVEGRFRRAAKGVRHLALLLALVVLATGCAGFRQRAAYDQCADAFEGVIESLRALDSRLEVGMTISEYRTAVQDLRVEVDGGMRTAPEGPCQDAVAVHLDAAVSAHQEVLGGLGPGGSRAVQKGALSAESGIPYRWRRATDRTDQAAAALLEMRR